MRQLWRRLFSSRRADVLSILAQFTRRRSELQEAFFRAASTSGKPRGLRWKSIDWQSDVVYARERETSELTALVGITIAFEAIPGSDMEGVAAVGNLRQASAVFFERNGVWQTVGRVVFNLTPAEALDHFHNQYEALELPEGNR